VQRDYRSDNKAEYIQAFRVIEALAALWEAKEAVNETSSS